MYLLYEDGKVLLRTCSIKGQTLKFTGIFSDVVFFLFSPLSSGLYLADKISDQNQFPTSFSASPLPPPSELSPFSLLPPPPPPLLAALRLCMHGEGRLAVRPACQPCSMTPSPHEQGAFITRPSP